MSDAELIERTLELAARGRGFVSPNPLVGCVIVKEGKIIGEGWHKKYGEAHAEVEAFRDCTADPAGATLYVNLEPCSHFGKTPPCTDLIINKKISRVVSGTGDPNPLVNGEGFAKLRSAGIEVLSAGSRSECEEVNKFFFKSVRTGEPYITIKAAQTIDGRIADSTGKSKWLSNEESRAKVHKLRSEYDAVLTGINTVQTDDPALNVRYSEGRDPDVIVVDKNLQISPGAGIFKVASSRRTIIITSEKAKDSVPAGLRQKVNEFIFVPEDISGKLYLREAFEELKRSGINSVLVEGGAGIYSYLIKNDLFDELLIFYTPKLLGGGLSVFTSEYGVAIESIKNLRLKSVTRFNNDILADYRRL